MSIQLESEDRIDEHLDHKHLHKEISLQVSGQASLKLKRPILVDKAQELVQKMALEQDIESV